MSRVVVAVVFAVVVAGCAGSSGSSLDAVSGSVPSGGSDTDVSVSASTTVGPHGSGLPSDDPLSDGMDVQWPLPADTPDWESFATGGFPFMEVTMGTNGDRVALLEGGAEDRPARLLVSDDGQLWEAWTIPDGENGSRMVYANRVDVDGDQIIIVGVTIRDDANERADPTQIFHWSSNKGQHWDITQPQDPSSQSGVDFQVNDDGSVAWGHNADNQATVWTRDGLTWTVANPEGGGLDAGGSIADVVATGDGYVAIANDQSGPVAGVCICEDCVRLAQDIIADQPAG